MSDAHNTCVRVPPISEELFSNFRNYLYVACLYCAYYDEGNPKSQVVYSLYVDHVYIAIYLRIFTTYGATYTRQVTHTHTHTPCRPEL